MKVPNRLTLEFLSDFLDELYGNGGPVFAVMRRLRDKHWPLSLVFCMCCARELRLAPPIAEVSPRSRLRARGARADRAAATNEPSRRDPRTR